jgi:predicted NBD/HSP70 family sugar kinase
MSTMRSFQLPDASRGTNQAGVKLYNERLVLSLIRKHRSLPKAEIARLTGLSMQTSSVITSQLERAGLLLREEPVRGKVGQPSVPMSLNPEGAFSLGFKLGRRSADLILMDLVGGVRRMLTTNYAYPTPQDVLHFLREGVAALIASLPPPHRDRVSGVGVAAPFELWSWEAEVGAPPAVVEAWRNVDLQDAIEAAIHLPVHVCKDATAACAAELAFGDRPIVGEALYVFVATLIGGGIVLNGSLYPGRTGYAGSLGSAPVPVEGGITPLIRRASLYRLEQLLREDGRDPALLRDSPDDWSAAGSCLDQWLDEAGYALAFAIASSLAIIDFQAVVIDGAMPAAIRERLVEAVRKDLVARATEGVAPVSVLPGSVGRDARVRGAACLPLLAAFSRDMDVLFRGQA